MARLMTPDSREIKADETGKAKRDDGKPPGAHARRNVCRYVIR